MQDFGQPTDPPVPPSLQLPFVSSHLTGLLRLCHCYARLMSTLGPIQSNDLDYRDAKMLTLDSVAEISGIQYSPLYKVDKILHRKGTQSVGPHGDVDTQ